jgi:dGTPase
MHALRNFMFERVYLAPPAAEEQLRIGTVVRAIFDALLERPEELPPTAGDDVQRATDYLAGMTDRFALRFHGAL